MFKAVADDVVKTLCTENRTLGLGQTVVAASSLHEAAHVKIGTFVIKKFPFWFWQSITYEYLTPLRVCFDESKSSEEVMVLEEINKAVDLTTMASAGISYLRLIGVSGSTKDNYEIDCDLGPVYRQELATAAIENYSVPYAVVEELNDTRGKKSLAIVSKVFIAEKAAAINLVAKSKDQAGASASKGSTGAEADSKEKKNTNKTFTMVKRQALAYCVQEVYFDPETETFALPADRKRKTKETSEQENSNASAEKDSA
ncbi:uncharacterized protein LOC142344204 [Convolutriloba macropyga]|uniref:uncharacterized protein LOC142344204 n=1 Tax=Convolutriloba macropyga TaxID=536237 RepID=UPI003F51ACBB